MAPQVLEALSAAEPNLTHVGVLAVDACRHEKGFRHFGHDIGPHDDPYSAGLGFAVDLGKNEFVGRAACLALKRTRNECALRQFAVKDGHHPLILHDEPIVAGARTVGRVTSAARTFRTQLTLGFGALEGLEADDLCVQVAGERFAIELLRKPPFDPNGLRMREVAWS